MLLTAQACHSCCHVRLQHILLPRKQKRSNTMVFKHIQYETLYRFHWRLIGILQYVSFSLLISHRLCRQTQLLSSSLSRRVWLCWIWHSLLHRIAAILSQACLWAELAASVQTEFVRYSLATQTTLWLACPRWCMLLAFSILQQFDNKHFHHT